MLSVCFVAAMKLTTAANTVVLQFTAPVWVAIFAPLFLKERTRARDWIFISVIFGGIFLFFLDRLSPGGMLGNLLALVSGVFFAAQALCLRRVRGDSPVQAMILGNFLCFGAGLWFWRPPFPDAMGVLMLLLLGVFQLGVSYWLYTLALPRAGALELVMITMLEPILSPLWVFLFLGERPGSWALLGGIVVLGAVFSWGALKAREDDRGEGKRASGARPAGCGPGALPAGGAAAHVNLPGGAAADSCPASGGQAESHGAAEIPAGPGEGR
jgi:drug/metabolite transporter (DMT)-like permease